MIRGTVTIAQILLLLLAIAGSIYFLKLKQKAMIVACCGCILAFSFLGLKFTQVFIKIEDEIIVTAQNEKSTESVSTEIDLLNLRVDGDVITSLHVVDGHWYSVSGRGFCSWRPPEDTRWDGTASESITIRVPVGWVRSIQFRGNTWGGYVAVEKPDGTTKIIDTYPREKDIYSCEIGRSDTKLLLLQGIADIFCYAVILGTLTYLFVLTIRKEGIAEKEKGKVEKKIAERLPSTKKQWVKSVLFALGLAVLLAVFAVSNLRDRIKTEAVILAPSEKMGSMPIVAQEQYIQTFTSSGTFNRIRLYLCTYDRENELSTTIQLVDNETGDILESWGIDNSSVSEEATELELKNARSKGTYRLVIEGHNPDPETSIGVYLQNKAKYNGELLVSGEPEDTNINLGLYQETKLGLFLLIGVLSAAVFCVWIAYVLLFIFELELWRIAFILMMGFGCVYIAIFPAGCTFDSWRHHVTAYHYSNELLGIKESVWGTVLMRTDDYNEFLRYRGVRSARNQNDASIAMYFEEFDEFSLWCQDNTMQDCGERSLDGGSIASSVAYAPQILGLTLGRILSLGTIPCMYLARFLQLLSAAILVTASIKIIPIGKEILLLISLLPIFRQQVTAFSYDGLSFGFAFLFIGVCTKLKVQEEKVSSLDYMILVLATSGLCSCRGGMYIFLLLLFLLIPKQVLGKFSKVYLSGVGTFTVISFFGKGYLSVPSAASSASTLSVGSPFQHPINVGLLFISSVIENIDAYWGGSLGRSMGWGAEGPVPYAVVIGFMAMMLIVSLADDNHVQIIDKKSRIVYLIPVVMTLGFCLGTMYLGESEHATQWNIWGVQGRYFIPVMPLLFFQVPNSFIVMKKNIRPVVIYAFCAWEVIEIFYLMRAFVLR